MTIDLLESGLKPAVAPALLKSEFDRANQDVFGRIGNLETRLARTSAEVEAALALRYKVFVEEMKAEVSAECHRRRKETDAFDAICDHLLVIDNAIDGDLEDRVVGTYRLLRQDVAAARGGFYSKSEFEVDGLIARHPDKRFMELGRSCVLPAYRTRRTVELLWQGNWAYALRHGVDAMFGCGSFPGIVPEEHALALSFLHHNALVQPDWYVKARPELYRIMDLMPAEAINQRKALAALPPLIKGYLRLGAMIGDGGVIDAAFNTTDVLVVLPITNIAGRYLNYYGADAGRFA
ncbi:GNAT family N-acetyltransferase [Rhizobium sp. SG2393]|uniref:GNAT family N-acetyltransferase n=1 Tax=Rhizobium sp. SG2393 TaxID=3276279 RepID=UPI00366C00F7